MPRPVKKIITISLEQTKQLIGQLDEHLDDASNMPIGTPIKIYQDDDNNINVGWGLGKDECT